MPAASATPSLGLKQLALACALSLGAAAPYAQAQSLSELYQAARGYDASYLAARALADSAQYKADQAHGLRRPTVNATVGATRNVNDQPSAAILGTPPQVVQYSSNTTVRTTSAGVAGTWALLNRANDATIAQADKGLESAQADLQVAEQDLIVRLAQTYFDVLNAQDTLATAQANKKAIAEQLASAKRNFEVGNATITDTREAQARFDLATAQEIAADNDLHTKRIALDQLVGRSDVSPKPLAAPVALPPLMPAGVEEWVAQTDQAPSVRKARVGYEVAQLETEKARAGHLPTLNLNAGYTKGHSNIDQSAFGQSTGLSGPVTQSNIGITLNVPLFAGYTVQNRVKETLLLEEQTRNNLEAARRGTAQATRQAFFGVQSGQAQVQALEAAESSSKLALEATELGYKVGVRVNIDVLNAQTQLYTTERDLAKARYDVIVNSLKLKQAAGTLQPDDIEASNRLLAQ
ncbi:MAG TPA: TolC family outer membrane protein [Methylibium sp.]